MKRNINLILFVVGVNIFFIKDAYSQSSSYYPVFKTCPVDSADMFEFQKQKDEIVYWFSNRKIENKKYQKKYNALRQGILVRIKETDLIKVEKGCLDAIALWRLDTIFYTEALTQNPSYVSVFTHELAHDAFPVVKMPKNLACNYLEDWMVSLIHQALESSKETSFGSYFTSKEFYDQPEEIYARLCAFRFSCRISPSEIITQEKLNIYLGKIMSKEIDDSNAEDLIKIISDQKHLILLLNNLP